MPCGSCGGVVEVVERGRPRKFCLTCRPRKRALVGPSDPAAATCVECGTVFHTRQPKLAKYCSSRCKEEARRVPCTACGEPMWFGSTLGPTPTCRPCRRARPGFRVRNLRASGVIEQWACAGCGTPCSRPATKGQRPKWCEECRRIKVSSGRWIAAATRRAIYDRDAWTCGICLEAVDRDLIGSRSVWRPALDHIVPRSAGGSNDPENLRLAHWWCNSTLNDGRTYSVEDFRVAV